MSEVFLYLKAYSYNSKKYQAYLQAFEEKMLYRTTETENPQTTKDMVRAVLDKFRSNKGMPKKKGETSYKEAAKNLM